MRTDFYTAIEKRRSYYALGKEAVTSDTRIQEVVEHAVKHVPSAFNSQSTRVCILLGSQHDTLWDMTTNILKETVGPDADFTATQQRMDGFKGAYGTILFFEDEEVVKQLQERFPLYADNFPLWSEQTSGMHQFAIWTGLEAEGYGASLQHYNPLIDVAVAQKWAIPNTWKLRAQMPFGNPLAEPNEKTFQPLDTRVKIYK
ncbi:nitroreductase family protein [Bacillus sp. FSL W7-1360]